MRACASYARTWLDEIETMSRSLGSGPPSTAVILPKAFHGISDGPDLHNYQYLVTIAVELEHGEMLRVAIPRIAVMTYQPPVSPPCGVKGWIK